MEITEKDREKIKYLKNMNTKESLSRQIIELEKEIKELKEEVSR